MIYSQKQRIKTFAKQCRRTIIEACTHAGNGHVGGSLSMIDYLSVLYLDYIIKSGDKVVISNGHVSPAMYAVLCELGLYDRNDFIEGFRRKHSIFEGHVSAELSGIYYGTGPLAIGLSAACGFAKSEKMKGSGRFVYATCGDGELQEGQAHEMMNNASAIELDNLIVFVDANDLQLSGSRNTVSRTSIKQLFAAHQWKVYEVDGHNISQMRVVLKKAHKQNRPVCIIGKTIMGKGVSFMEKTAKQGSAAWHGSAPKQEEADTALSELALRKSEQRCLTKIAPLAKRVLAKPVVRSAISAPMCLYGPDTMTDCRSAYGSALLDLARNNKHIVAFTADLAGSVKTSLLQKEYPQRHIDVGIAEQHMVTMAGAMSLSGFIPFVSSFGAFLSSRARDQVRVNAINNTNVKLIATHCGLSVGEDGPTHQAIDDVSSIASILNMKQIEVIDPNHCDRVIKTIARDTDNYYVRMGRHKVPVVCKEDGSPFYDLRYKYKHGKCDLLRKGKKLTIIAAGSSVHEALRAYEALDIKHKGAIEIIAVSSLQVFDTTLLKSLNKTKKALVIQDHVGSLGLGAAIGQLCLLKGIALEAFKDLNVQEYQKSATVSELYKKAKIDYSAIIKESVKLL